MLYKNIYIDIVRNVNESDKEFVIRKWFMAKNLEINKSTDFKTLEILSNNYIKSSIYGVTFDDEITKLLEECVFNLFN